MATSICDPHPEEFNRGWRKYERDIDLLLAEEFSVSPPFATWFLSQTKAFKGVDARVVDVYVSRSDATGESDIVVLYERIGGTDRFALHLEDKIDAPLQPEQELRYRDRGNREVNKGLYTEFEVVLCSPENYRNVHLEAATFDSFVTYQSISKFLTAQDPTSPRSKYRANFIATAVMKKLNTWGRWNDEVTNAFWKVAFTIATNEFIDLEAKPLEVTKGSTWINFRPMDMPTQPRRIYISFKGSSGFMDLTFTACIARLFLPQVKAILGDRMTVHQTGKATAIRITVEPFVICEPNDAVLAKVRAAFSACVELIHFYRQHRETLNKAAATSLTSDQVSS